jgi:signal transduction histidine kinase
LGPRTLRWQLALSVTALIGISFAITFVAVYRGTGSSLSQQIDRDLAGDAATLSRTLQKAPGHSARQLRVTAERYVSSQPYTGSSSLLFALVPGEAPASNQPELLSKNAPADEGETVAEQQQENRAALALTQSRGGYSTVKLPDVGQLRLLRRDVPTVKGPTVVIGVGESLTPVHRAQVGVARAFILAGVLVLVCALAAAYLLGTRLSAPLRRVAGVAARVDAGDLHPRIHDLRHPPDEVRVLADAFNHMLDRLTEAFAGQRAFVADASHELRTPLTVMRGQLELLALDDTPSADEVRRVTKLVQTEIARISRLVDDLLLLAKAERSELLRPETVDIGSYVAELWDAARMLAARRFELGAIPAGTLRVDPDRLTQALRNLISNAVQHTASPDGLVRVSAVAEGARIRFIVDDDGPGIAADQRQLVFGRFHRTDSARDRGTGGAGLGLAIVQAIAQSHGGWVQANSSPDGGARIELELPGFTPAKSAARVSGRRDLAAGRAHQ